MRERERANVTLQKCKIIPQFVRFRFLRGNPKTWHQLFFFVHLSPHTHARVVISKGAGGTTKTPS